jgi:rhodanese-related sulfurtransferase
MPLSDDVTVYPAHGAGSACGKNMMKETVDTLGNQKKVNYALNQPNKEEFVKAVTDGLLPPPGYFGSNVAMNKKGIESFETVLNNGMRALSPLEFEAAVDTTDSIVLDTRDAAEFAKGFIPRSINIGINGDFAPWVGSLIKDVKQSILLVTELGLEEETVTRLSRVGFDNVIGHLKGSFVGWKETGKEIDTVNRITANQFAKDFDVKADTVIDVRRESEYRAEHVEDSYNKPLDQINSWFAEMDNEKPFYLHCAGGYRSMIAASILKSRGVHNFKEIEGGFKAIAEAGVSKTDYVCQSKLQKS